MYKLFLISLVVTFCFLNFGCSSDDEDCPETMIVDINDPQTVSQAEACGLSPAAPLGNLWVSENYKRNNLSN